VATQATAQEFDYNTCHNAQQNPKYKRLEQVRKVKEEDYKN
jgi:hypothetical protein